MTLSLTLSLSDSNIEWLAKKIINTCFMMYGPILTTLCIYGFFDYKYLAKVCNLSGVQNQTNYINIFILVVSFLFSLTVTFTMLMEKTMDMAHVTFTNENSIIFRLSTMYFQY
jgi:hypothetical protein